MACTRNSDRISQFGTRAGIPRLVSQRAFQIGVAAADAFKTVAAAVRKRRKQQDVFSAQQDRTVFNQKAGEILTTQFGGAEIGENTIKAIIGGPDSKTVPLDEENKLVLLDGPRGQIFYHALPKNQCQIGVVVPRRGFEADLRVALDVSTPIYVITDRVTGQEYETRDPEEARHFFAALGRQGGMKLVHQGDDDRHNTRKRIPTALFY